MNDEVGTNGSVIFKIIGDGREKFQSGVLRGGEMSRNISVDITGVRQLQLVVTDAGDGNFYDRADWAMPTLVCAIDGTPVTTLKWSDPATWQSLGQPVPAEGATVTIPAGQTVLLDTDTPALAGLHVNGQLHLAEAFTDTNTNGQLDVRTGFVMVHGELHAGSETDRYDAKAAITLTGTQNTDVTGMNMGAKVLGVMGGKLELHGQDRVSWTRLNATANAGATTLTLAEAVDWQPGDRLIVTTTSHDRTQTEEVTVQSVSSNRVTLTAPLQFRHWGQKELIAGFTVDQRAYVGRLTRNIVVQGDETSETSGFGGHVMVMQGGGAKVQGVEFRFMGQKGLMGRYPMHWHMNGDRTGDYLKDSSIHHTFNRFASIHGTDGVLVEENVGFETIGHGWFLEDGAEQHNSFIRNLGVNAKAARSGEALLPSDLKGSAFWISNPNNTFVGNAAIGSDNNGFWVALPLHPTGLSANRTDLWPSRTSLGVFRGNDSVANRNWGLFIERNGDVQDNSRGHEPRLDPTIADIDSNPAPGNGGTAVYEDFTAHHNGSAVWLGGDQLTLTNPVVSDHARGSQQRAPNSVIQGGVFVGKTSNFSRDARIMEPLLGTATYGGRVTLRDVTFANYPAAEGAGLRIEEHNTVLQDKDYLFNLNFVNANRVWTTAARSTPEDPERHALVFKLPPEVLGLTGTKKVAFVENIPFVLTNNCVNHPEWNASICNEHYMHVTLGRDFRNLPVPYTFERPDGQQYHMSYGTGVAMRNREYKVHASGAAPTSYELKVTHLEQSGDYLLLNLPFGKVPTRIYRDYFHRYDLTPAASKAEVLADPEGTKYYYDAAAQRLYIKAAWRSEMLTEPRLGDFANIWVN